MPYCSWLGFRNLNPCNQCVWSTAKAITVKMTEYLSEVPSHHMADQSEVRRTLSMPSAISYSMWNAPLSDVRGLLQPLPGFNYSFFLFCTLKPGLQSKSCHMTTACYWLGLISQCDGEDWTTEAIITHLIINIIEGHQSRMSAFFLNVLIMLQLQRIREEYGCRRRCRWNCSNSELY